MAAEAVAEASIDNEALIAAVEARQSLWLARHKDHRNRHRKAVLWREVADIALPGVRDGVTAVQKRWKSLRDKFRRLYTEMSSRKSGAAADEDDFECTWPYFELLLFLRDTMETRPTSGNFTDSQEQSAASQDESSSAAVLLEAMCGLQPTDLDDQLQSDSFYEDPGRHCQHSSQQQRMCTVTPMRMRR
ncbi:hypothetical protein HPB50_012759 [Hyalomma asiaticum]|uniref:Uncharacterized protein n=1 Tax=Hyalomma asiaticum TaxID=266040 RepID=A0ACB7TJN5_HYAAI|nr:hypothetical protein HPB50_012759 [Hyalomma asiaticum]